MKNDFSTENRNDKWAHHVPHLRLDEAAYLLTSKLRPDVKQLSSDERTVVLNACLFWNGHGWRILAVVIMPDHFHIAGFMDTNEANKSMAVANLVKSIKGYSAREINKLRDTKGGLWQREYHDRLLLNERALRSAIEYVIGNPVKVGLAEKPDDYPWLWTEWNECDE